MKFKNFLFNLTICIMAILLGLAWVGIYQFFLGFRLTNNIEPATIQHFVEPEFDINNPESVLPIDYKEEELSDPKEDENNPKYFDPEGRYYILEESKKFDEFFLLTINNKNFEVASNDEKFGDLIPPQGTILLEDTDKGSQDSCEMHDYLDIQNLKIENGKLSFISKKKNGITYEFSGEFLVKGNFYTLDLDAKVLKGNLVKKKNGKTIAKETLTFGWDNSDICLH